MSFSSAGRLCKLATLSFRSPQGVRGIGTLANFKIPSISNEPNVSVLILGFENAVLIMTVW